MTIGFATLAVGRKGKELLEISGPFLREWARQIGAAAFYTITEAPDGYPLAGKFNLSKIIPRHDRTIFVDADVIPDLGAMPDLVASVPVNSIGMHDDLPLLGNIDWAAEFFGRLTESQGWTWSGPPHHIWNTGVIVASRHHAELFAPPQRSFPAEHCSEQFLIQLAIERAGVPVHPLDKRLNWQWWVRRRMPGRSERPDIAIRHFAGTSQPKAFGTTHADRLRLMNAAAAELRSEPIADRQGRRCLHLGPRVEFRHGCGGWNCRHECDKGLVAVPGGTCLYCPSFEDDGRF